MISYQYLPTVHDCGTRDGISMYTESDETVLDISVTEEATTETGDAERYETTVIAEEK